MASSPVQGPRGLAVSVTRQIEPGETHSIDVNASQAGDLFSGTIKWDGACTVEPAVNAAGCTSLTVTFVDPSGAPVRAPHDLWLQGGGRSDRPERTGFVPPNAGVHRVQIASSRASTRGTYTLELERRSPSERLTGTRVHSRQEYRSARIEQLVREIEAGRAGAEDAFWSEMRAKGSPLIEPIEQANDSMLATFVWEARYETHNVLLRWPPAYIEPDDYYMTHVPNTRVWYKSVRAWKGTRVQYVLAPNDSETDRELVSQRDPLNPRSPYAADSFTSLFELPGAPDDTYVRQRGSARGRIEPFGFVSQLVKFNWDAWIYTPPGYDPAGEPYPLVVLIPGYMYRQGLQTPHIVDNLVSAQKIRSPVVCFVQMPPLVQADRRAVARALASELVPQIHARYRVSSNPSDAVVGGFSAGGAWAAFIAVQESGVFGNVLSHSGAYQGPWVAGTLEYSGTPARSYVETARQPIRFYMSTGLYEPFTRPDFPAHERSLRAGLTIANRHFRDVLKAKGYDVIYREVASAHDNLQTGPMLVEGLIALLGPPVQ